MFAQQGLVLDEFRACLHAADLSASSAGGTLYTSLSCCLLFYSIALLNMPLKGCPVTTVANAKPAFLRACTDANLLRSYVGLHDGNRIYFAFMRTLVRELLRRVKPRSLVFIHDGLLISPELACLRPPLVFTSCPPAL